MVIYHTFVCLNPNPASNVVKICLSNLNCQTISNVDSGYSHALHVFLVTNKDPGGNPVKYYHACSIPHMYICLLNIKV